MRAILLAAGVGKRLGPAVQQPKCLLEFGGRTLLDRHLDALLAAGVQDITICVGYQADAIVNALTTRRSPRTLMLYNPIFTLGSIVSLWTARSALQASIPVLVMDADVLYDPAILQRLVASEHANCFLLDRDFEAGEEPVKICLNGERIVEFRKQIDPTLTYNSCGESVGFFKFDGATSLALAGIAHAYVAGGQRDQPHEEALRELALQGTTFCGIEDVTGLPWIEIDFPEDIQRARDEILPSIDGRTF